MASFVYNPAKAEILRADHDFETGDFRLLLAMTNTTFDTEDDDEFVADTTTADEMDGANYVRKTLAGEAVSADLVNNRGEFTFSAVTWTALGNGTRQLEGIVLFRFVTVDADSPLIAFIDPTGWPLNPGGADLTITPNAEGVIQLT